MPRMASNYDCILAGGGLANVLLFWRLRQSRPDLQVALIERGETLGGNHTWSFHTTDVSASQYKWLQPFIAQTWSGQEVLFPASQRALQTGYNSISSHHLHAVVSSRLADSLILNAEISELDIDKVTLADGRTFAAPCIVDGRGLDSGMPLALGYQKFLGLEIEMANPHGLARPVIMDASVNQLGGYRFVYCLPFTPTRMLVEDTYYADGRSLKEGDLLKRIEDYVESRSWTIARIERLETGVLPIVLDGDIEALWDSINPKCPRVGLRACLFHPTTGYSLPDAVAVADEISALREVTSRSVFAAVRSRSVRLWKERSFFRLLNRMLFLAAEPEMRVGVFEWFYRLPQPLIERFYAADLLTTDKARILAGRPPVPLWRAIKSINCSAAWEFAGRTEHKLSSG